MQLRSMAFLCFLFLSLASTVVLAWGSSRPDWVDRPKREDSTYKYYVGRATYKTDEAEGHKKATQNAYESAIRENFGIETAIEVSDFETNMMWSLTKRVSEKSQKVRIKGFEQIGIYKEEAGSDSYTLWLLFQYKKSDILAEKNRLKNNQGFLDAEWTDIGEVTDQKGTYVEVNSSPSGAEVFIDGIRWGVTPVRIKGLVDPGSHKLLVSHSRFEDVNERLIVVSGKHHKIHKVLRPAKGYLNIDTQVDRATVKINGKYIGKTPISEFPVQVGKPLNLVVTHPEADPYSTLIEVKKNSVRDLNLQLSLKPVQIQFQVEPEVSSVKLNGTQVSVNGGQVNILTSPGSHHILIEADDYESIKKYITLSGGQRRNLGKFHLKLAPPKPITHEEEPDTAGYYQPNPWDSKWHHKSFIVGLSCGLGEKSAPGSMVESRMNFNFTLEKRFLYFFGLRAGVGYEFDMGSSSTDYGNSYVDSPTYEMSGSNYSLGIPLYLSTTPEGWYVMGEVGGLKQSFESSQFDFDNFSYPIIELTQKRTGISIGYQNLESHYDIKFTQYNYELPGGEKYPSLSVEFSFISGSR